MDYKPLENIGLLTKSCDSLITLDL
jgi:hypothetical protein